jgi:hypothetical protein
MKAINDAALFLLLTRPSERCSLPSTLSRLKAATLSWKQHRLPVAELDANVLHQQPRVSHRHLSLHLVLLLSSFFSVEVFSSLFIAAFIWSRMRMLPTFDVACCSALLMQRCLFQRPSDATLPISAPF